MIILLLIVAFQIAMPISTTLITAAMNRMKNFVMNWRTLSIVKMYFVMTWTTVFSIIVLTATTTTTTTTTTISVTATTFATAATI